jgi:2-hydroxy-3-oxopropionate reductase
MTAVAILGLGLMGRPMAVRLAEGGHRVRAWNRSALDTPEVEAAGVRRAGTVAEAVAGAALVVASLSDGPASLAVLGATGLSDHLAPDAVVADMGSNDPATARDLGRRLGPRFVDAPVSGGPTGAAAGTLSIFLGAEDAAAARAAGLLAPLGRVTRMGGVGMGQAAKLANQVIVAGTLAALSEGLAAAEAMGVDPARLAEAMAGGYADSRILQVAGPRMIAGDFAARGRASTHLKDLRNAFGALPPGAEGVLAATVAARAHLLAATAGGDDPDHSAMLLAVRAGLGRLGPRP